MSDVDKTGHLSLRIKPSDMAAIEAAAKKAGMRRSEWLRAVIAKAAKRELSK